MRTNKQTNKRMLQVIRNNTVAVLQQYIWSLEPDFHLQIRQLQIEKKHRALSPHHQIALRKKLRSLRGTTNNCKSVGLTTTQPTVPARRPAKTKHSRESLESETNATVGRSAFLMDGS